MFACVLCCPVKIIILFKLLGVWIIFSVWLASRLVSVSRRSSVNYMVSVGMS